MGQLSSLRCSQFSGTKVEISRRHIHSSYVCSGHIAEVALCGAPVRLREKVPPTTRTRPGTYQRHGSDQIRNQLLELNALPGLSIQIANDAGPLPRRRHVEALEIFAPSVEDRLDYAMQAVTGVRSAIQTNLREET
jgi:hypothetical protein